MRFFAMIVSVFVSAPLGFLISMIAEHFVASPNVCDKFDGYPSLTIICLGAFTGMLVGWMLIMADHHEKGYQISIVFRVLPISASWSMFQLAIHFEHTPSAIVFGILAISTFAAGLFCIITERRNEMAAYLLYFCGGLAIAVFGLFLSGERILTFERDESSQVTAKLETRRWLGLATIDVRRIDGVKAYENKHQVDEFDDKRIDGVVLIGNEQFLLVPGDVSYTTGLASRISDVLPAFLDGTGQERELRERIPFATLPATMLIAALFPFLGLTVDPLVGPPTTKFQRSFGRLVRWMFALTFCLTVFQFTYLIWQFRSGKSDAKKRLENASATVLETDLMAGGDILYGGAWKVTMNNPQFADVDLIELIPYLQHAPGLWLDLSNTRITDEGLRSLVELDPLVMLSLRQTDVTFRALDRLNHASIQYLDVRKTKIVAADLDRLKDRYLTHLLFSDPEFTARSVPVLFRIKGLKYVFIDSPQLTPEELSIWKEELQDVTVELPSG